MRKVAAGRKNVQSKVQINFSSLYVTMPHKVHQLIYIGLPGFFVVVDTVVCRKVMAQLVGRKINAALFHFSHERPFDFLDKADKNACQKTLVLLK